MSRDTIRLPHDAYWLLQTLRAAGHSAYVVGGCVRDSLLGRMPGDWDICTSARPDEMRALFHDQRMILTGKKHGTDALRILRALRFSAKLGFALDAATAEAAFTARETLHTVSAERLYSELDGLLLAPGAGQTLAQYGEILGGVVPEILPCIGCTQPGKWHCYDVWQHSAAAVAALDLRGQDTRGVRVLCWATFLHDIAKPLCRSVGPDGAAHFKGHNQRGAQLARVILRRLKAPAYLIDGAVGLTAVMEGKLPNEREALLKAVIS